MISLSRPDDVGQASCRTFAGFDLHTSLTVCREHLVSYGGHKFAAGLKIERDKIDEFRTAFCEYVAAHHEVTRRDREIAVDAEVRLADLTWKAVKQIDELGPFGSENPRPKFAASKVEVIGEPRKVGEGERHLQLRLRHYGTTMKAIAFGAADWAEEMVESGGNISICFQPTINRFRGNESVEMLLVDWQPGATLNDKVDSQAAAAS
jgi:single-stranded-DNA-specific exonuclease